MAARRAPCVRALLPLMAVVIALWDGATAAAEAPEKGPGLSLKDFYERAQRRFPGVQAAREAVNAARYTRNEQKWLRLPSGEITGYLTGSPSLKCKDKFNLQDANGTNVAPAYVGGHADCLETNTAFTLTDTNIGQVLPLHGVLFRLDMRVNQPLYTFGKLSAASALGQVGLDLAQATADGSLGDLGVNVVRAYFGLKAARAATDTLKDAQEQLGSWIKRIDKDLERGKGGYTEIDLIRLKMAASQVDLGVADMDRTIKSTLAAVRYLTQDQGADIDQTDLDVAYEDEHELSYFLDQALLHRPEVKQIAATGRGAEAYRKLRIAELLPDFGLVLNFSYWVATGVEDPDNAFMNRFNALGAGLGLGMRLPLDYGPRVARLQKAQADLRQFEAKRRELLGGVALEVERTYNDLTEARTRLKTAEAAERRARGWLQAIKQNMSVGTAESRDLIEALRAYFDQHLLVLRSINDVNTTAATLRRQCGLDILPN